MAVATLFLLGALLGIAMLLVFRATSNQPAIARAKARLQASVYEMLLFSDEPALVLRAQASLIVANVRYLGLMLVPVAVMTLPMLLLFARMENVYGVAPLAPGSEAVVVLQMRGPLDPAAPPPALQAPDGIAVETPAVRIPSENQLSWRIRAQRAAAGELRVLLPEGAVEKRVVAGAAAGLHNLASRRVSSWLDHLWHPGESAIPGSTVDWIEIDYPRAEVRWLGFEMHWLSWVLVFSIASALLFKRRFKVSF